MMFPNILEIQVLSPALYMMRILDLVVGCFHQTWKFEAMLWVFHQMNQMKSQRGNDFDENYGIVFRNRLCYYALHDACFVNYQEQQSLM